MPTQEEFDAQTAAINAAIDTLTSAVQAETQQIADFIANNQTVDTSALAAVVDRLTALDTAVQDIFTPPA